MAFAGMTVDTMKAVADDERVDIRIRCACALAHCMYVRRHCRRTAS